ncbi:MAG: low molecular weight protein arginine phosphatase [Herpetosiphonaceae bacterium]|nr:low molecular weight protein arginine phosphatase [Herpetosiphonaceae bacterium]
MNTTPAVLFVCTANLCRSPIAMGLFAQQAGKRDQGRVWRIESAGTWTVEGSSVPRNVQLAVEERSIDLRHHRARTVSRALLQSFDLVLVMTADQREALELEFPEVASNVHLLSEMAGYKYDVPDPINGSIKDVRMVAHEIALLLNSGFEWIAQQIVNRREQTTHLVAKTEQVLKVNTSQEW